MYSVIALGNLIRLKVERLQRELRRYDVEALILGKEFSKYLFPEVYDPLLGFVSNYVVLDLDSLEVVSICAPIQAPTIQDVYHQVRVVVVDPQNRVDLGVPRFSDDVKAIRYAIGRKRRIGYAGSVPVDKLKDMLMIGLDSILKKIVVSKLDEEIERIKRSVEITEKALQNAVSEISPGLSEIEIASIIYRELVEKGCEALAFPIIVAVGRASREPHHIPTRFRFNGKQPILVDLGVRVGGYCSDITRMILPRRLDDEYRELPNVINAVSEAIDRALKVLRGGVLGSDVYKEALKGLREHGYDSLFIHGLGHGLGIDVHEEPYLSHRWEYPIPSGCVVTVEPGVYLREFGVRIEEDILVRENGVEQISKSPRVIEL